jgi:SAM-dependent methyltransferase
MRLARVCRRAMLVALALLATAGRAQTASDEEVPFITTPDRVTLAMLQLADVGPADRLIDLGSGDGRIVITAARLFGARGLGVDIVPDLVARSEASAAQAGVADRARFRVQDLFETDLAGASVITLYLLPEFNLRLRPRLLALKPGTRIVSHDWDMGDWAPDRTLTLDVPEKAIGREKRSRLHLWVVPARLQGLWCGPGGLALQVQQRYQAVEATLQAGAEQWSVGGRIHGTRLALEGPGEMAGWLAEAEPGGGLRVVAAAPHSGLLAGQRLQATSGTACPTGRLPG